MTKIDRIKIEKEKNEKREKLLKDLEMRCDICYRRDFNEVLILRSKRFSRLATKKIAKANRVCWGCARWLFKSGLYNFGITWRNLFFDQMGTSKINRKAYVEKREKLMVIHA